MDHAMNKKSVPVLGKVAGFLLLLLSQSMQADATVLVNSNLDGASDSGFGNSSGKGIAFTLGNAAAFGTTGYNLDSIVVKLKTVGTVPAPTDYRFALYTNDGTNTPGTLIISFTSVTLPINTTANYTFTPVSAFVLQPSTTYWIAATSNQAPDAVYWQFGGAAPTTFAAGISVPAIVSYFGPGDPGTWGPPSTSGNYTDIQINATAIPESPSLAVAAAGLIPLLLRVRRRAER
jgi:hypothetical protein